MEFDETGNSGGKAAGKATGKAAGTAGGKAAGSSDDRNGPKTGKKRSRGEGEVGDEEETARNGSAKKTAVAAKSGAWSEIEDGRLLRAAGTFATSTGDRWQSVAQAVGRTPKACKARHKQLRRQEAR